MRTVAAWVLIASIAGAAGTARAEEAVWEGHWKGLFPANAKLVRLSDLQAGEEAYEVQSTARKTLGWVFRSDTIEPKVKGRNGEVGVLVAVGADRKILGLKVFSHREDKKWFDRLQPAFYDQFKGHAADEAFDDVHTVTGATLSSRAIVRDAFLSAQEFFKRPSVQAKLKPAAGPPAAVPAPAARPAPPAPR